MGWLHRYQAKLARATSGTSTSRATIPFRRMPLQDFLGATPVKLAGAAMASVATGLCSGPSEGPAILLAAITYEATSTMRAMASSRDPGGHFAPNVRIAALTLLIDELGVSARFTLADAQPPTPSKRRGCSFILIDDGSARSRYAIGRYGVHLACCFVSEHLPPREESAAHSARNCSP